MINPSLVRRTALAALTVLLVATGCTATTTLGEAGGDTAASGADSTADVSESGAGTSPDPTAEATATPVPIPTIGPEPTPTPLPVPTPTTAPEPPPTPAVDAMTVSSLDESPCPAEAAAPEVTCYTATLPLYHHDPEHSTISVAVAVVDNGDDRGIGPVVYLQGGPGLGGIDYADNFVGVGHSIVFFDARGTGHSVPKLDCPEAAALWVSRHTAVQAEQAAEGDVVEAYVDCGERLRAEGIDLDAFNTAAVAADADLIREMLGYDEWSIWGVSYGSRLGLTMMRDHPDAIRAAVLDSVVPFEVDFFASLPENALRSFAMLDAACDAEDCATDHGDFLTQLSDAVMRLDESPMSVEVVRPVSGERFDFLLDGSTLLDIAFVQMYSTRRLKALPRQVARLDHGGAEELVSGYARRRDPEIQDLAVGVYYSTWCREEVPFHDPATAEQVFEDTTDRFGDALEDALGASSLDDVCEAFAVTPGPETEDAPIESDIPTLVFAGSFDPVTPPEWSRQVADALSDATYVEMPDHGHGMLTSCPWEVRMDFLADPSAEVDVACAEATEVPDLE